MKPAREELRSVFHGVTRGLVVSLIVSSIAVAIAVAPYSTVRAGTADPNWSRQSTGQAPSPRAWASMDFDSRRSRTVVFGGYDGNSNLSDTW